MELAIIAGGKGTRLGLKDKPKSMMHIGGKPLLERQVNLARKYGIKNINILLGYLADVIMDYFGDGSKFGVKIRYFIENYPLGTAGAVKQLECKVKDRFMIFYGDVLLDMDLASFIKFDSNGSSIATIAVHPNDHPFDSDLVEINDDECIVTAFHPKPHDKNNYYRNLVNAAVYIFSPDVFKYIPNGEPSDFGTDIFPLLLKNREVIRAYRTAEYIKDMGTIDRLQGVSDDYLSGKVESLSKRHKRPAIFLDRDGTLIRDVDLLYRTDDLEPFSFLSASIKKINNSDHLCFLITNQPVVARNLCDIDTVKQIHNKLESLLGKEGAYLNDIYFCPHHPDRGYPEENLVFKIDCKCRKPKTEMIDRAVKEYNVDVENSWFIGDTTTDIQTGINARLKTILVRTGKGGKDGKFNCNPDFIFDDLDKAIDFILADRYKYEVYIREILEKVERCRDRIPFLIGVAGLSRSGKSTFVNLLKKSLNDNSISTRILSLDNWLVGAGERTDDMTVRQRYKCDEIVRDVGKLINHEKILLKIYNPYSREIVGEKFLSLDGIECLVIDGVITLEIDDLRNILNIKIYVEIDEDCRKRRIFSFYKWKDLSEKDIECLYLQRIKDEVPFIEGSKKYADIIVKI
ncbi:MAG: HAD-IIIA family hydrolase [Candidatus Brocadiaceae bacterium]|nr:HAD-IIIA family hydrolase [Candidatus Brocadiaceae bacterium]